MMLIMTIHAKHRVITATSVPFIVEAQVNCVLTTQFAPDRSVTAKSYYIFSLLKPETHINLRIDKKYF